MSKTSKTPSKSTTPATTTQRVSNPVEAAEHKGANILAYAVGMVAIYLIANAAFISGALFLAGCLVILPRSPFLTKVPTIVGWILVAIGFTTLS